MKQTLINLKCKRCGIRLRTQKCPETFSGKQPRYLVDNPLSLFIPRRTRDCGDAAPLLALQPAGDGQLLLQLLRLLHLQQEQGTKPNSSLQRQSCRRILTMFIRAGFRIRIRFLRIRIRVFFSIRIRIQVKKKHIERQFKKIGVPTSMVLIYLYF